VWRSSIGVPLIVLKAPQTTTSLDPKQSGAGNTNQNKSDDADQRKHAGHNPFGHGGVWITVTNRARRRPVGHASHHGDR